MLRKTFWVSSLAALACFAALQWRKPASPPGASPAFTAAASGRESSVTGSGTFKRKVLRSHMDLHDRVTALGEEIQNRLNSGDETERDIALTNLLLQLTALDPAASGRLATSIEPGSNRNDALRAVAEAWTDKDPAAALAWAAQLPDADEQQKTLAMVLLRMATSDPAQAVNLAREYHLDSGSYDLMPTLAVQWAGTDLAAALSWAGTQPASEERDEIIARIAFVESQNSPAQAGARVLAEIPPGPAQEEAVMTVIHQWSLKDMAGALAWVQNFPDIPLKQRALTEMKVIAGRF